jgi:hypothetical protein
MKKFYFVGDSTTYGQDLSAIQRETVSYPALVSKYHAAECVNDGIIGNANNLVISQVLQNIGKYDKIYILFTFTNRFTLYDPKNWYPVNFNELLTSSNYQNIDYYKNFGRYYYGFWSSPLFEFKDFLEQIVMLQATLEQKNQSYLMWFGSSTIWTKLICEKKDFINNLSTLIDITKFDDHQILQQWSEIQHLYNQIDLKNLMSPLDFEGIDSVLRQFPVGPTGHTLEEGHRCIADNILKFEQHI